MEWLDHFAESVPGGVSQDCKHLLLVDGHKSHMTLAVVTKAANLGVDIAVLPPHTTHRLQPLDVSVFKSFKTNFSIVRDRFTAINPSWANGDFSKKSLAMLASQALQQALTVSNIQSCFQKSGIYPLNPKAMDLECFPSTLFEEFEDDLEESDHGNDTTTNLIQVDSLPTDAESLLTSSGLTASIVYPSR